jgi:aminoglycoside phosphotransferase (APT) family kinase protein
MPCDAVARVTPLTHFTSPELEVELVRRLAGADSPVATLDVRVEPRVVVRDGFEISLWTHVESVPSRPLPPGDYAAALTRLHAGLRQIDLPTPHVVDRIESAHADVMNRDVTPDLSDPDRALLADTLLDLRESIVHRRGPEQLLHGEPHPWNVLDTKDGPLLIDFENTARGPIEYDLGWVPKEVSERYPDADQDLVDKCRGIVLAIIAMHRWSRDDVHPSGRESGIAFLEAVRAGPPWPSLDTV